MGDVDIFSVTPLLGLVSSPLNNIDHAPSLAVSLQLTMASVLYSEMKKLQKVCGNLLKLVVT